MTRHDRRTHLKHSAGDSGRIEGGGDMLDAAEMAFYEFAGYEHRWEAAGGDTLGGRVVVPEAPEGSAGRLRGARDPGPRLDDYDAHTGTREAPYEPAEDLEDADVDAEEVARELEEAAASPPDSSRSAAEGPGHAPAADDDWEVDTGPGGARCAAPGCRETGGLLAVEWSDGHAEPRCREHAARITDQTDRATAAGPWGER